MMDEKRETITETRDFPLSGILGVTTGRLMGDIGELYEVLGFMTGGPVWTHELPAAARLAAPEIARQHPDLPTEADDIGVTDQATAYAYLASAIEKYGATRTLTPIPDYTRTKSPVETAIDMMGENRVIEVES